MSEKTWTWTQTYTFSLDSDRLENYYHNYQEYGIEDYYDWIDLIFGYMHNGKYWWHNLPINARNEVVRYCWNWLVKTHPDSELLVTHNNPYKAQF